MQLCGSRHCGKGMEIFFTCVLHDWLGFYGVLVLILRRNFMWKGYGYIIFPAFEFHDYFRSFLRCFLVVFKMFFSCFGWF